MSLYNSDQLKDDINKTFDIIGTTKMYDRQRFFTYLLDKGRTIYREDFVLPNSLKEIYLLLLRYAAQFDNNELDPDKGLLLMGMEGCGKTAIMHLLKPFFQHKMQYDIVNSRELSIQFSLRGYEALEKHLHKKSRPICLDSVGKEKAGKYFGTNSEIVYDIVTHFYENRYNYNYPHLHMTTALSAKELEQRYGTAFRKMLKELFNVVVVKI